MYRIHDQPVPGYALVERMGHGALGDVWKAIGPGGVPVAVKIVALRQASIAREFQGVNRLKSINHPHLVSISGIWLKDEFGRVIPPDDSVDTRRDEAGSSESAEHLDRACELIIVMDLCEKSLDKRREECVREGLPGIPRIELLKYMRQAADAIDFLNGTHGIQHCDIKPANIMVVGGGAQVCDYGLAEQWSDARATRDFAGTPAYAAPELLERGQPTTKTDQYSLAITYYELATGKLPHAENATRTEKEQAIRRGKLDFSGVGTAEADVLRRATALKHDSRFAGCEQFVDELGRAVQAESRVGAKRRRPWWTYAAAAFMTICIVLAALTLGNMPLGAARGNLRAQSHASRLRQWRRLRDDAAGALRHARDLADENAPAEDQQPYWTKTIAHELAARDLAEMHNTSTHAPTISGPTISDSDLAEAYRQRARGYYQADDYRRALADLDSAAALGIVQNNSEDEHFFAFMEGNCRLRLGEANKALRPLYDAVVAEPSKTQWLADLARACVQAVSPKMPTEAGELGQLVSAIELLQDRWSGPAGDDVDPVLFRDWVKMQATVALDSRTHVDEKLLRHAVAYYSRLADDPRTRQVGDYSTRLALRLRLVDSSESLQLDDAIEAVWDDSRGDPMDPMDPMPRSLARCYRRYARFLSGYGVALRQARLPLVSCLPPISALQTRKNELAAATIGEVVEVLPRLLEQNDAPKQRAADLIQLGLAHYDLGQYSLALQRFDEVCSSQPSEQSYYYRAVARWKLLSPRILEHLPEDEPLPNDLATQVQEVIDDIDAAVGKVVGESKNGGEVTARRVKAHYVRAAAYRILGPERLEDALDNLRFAASHGHVLAIFDIQETSYYENRFAASIAAGREMLRIPGRKQDGFSFQNDAYRLLAYATAEAADHVEPSTRIAHLIQAERLSKFAVQSFRWADLADRVGSASDLLDVVEQRSGLRDEIVQEAKVFGVPTPHAKMVESGLKTRFATADKFERAEGGVRRILSDLMKQPPEPESEQRVRELLGELADSLSSHPDLAIRNSSQIPQLRIFAAFGRHDQTDPTLETRITDSFPDVPILKNPHVIQLLGLVESTARIAATCRRISLGRRVEDLTCDLVSLASPWGSLVDANAVQCRRLASVVLATQFSAYDPVHRGLTQLVVRLAVPPQPGRELAPRPWRTTPIDLLILWAGR